MRQGTQSRAKGRLRERRSRPRWRWSSSKRAHRVVSRTIDAPFDAESEMRFEDANGGTQVSYHMEAEIPGGFFGTLAAPLAAKLFAKDVRASLEKMKNAGRVGLRGAPRRLLLRPAS